MILDLEDSVPAELKAAARRAIEREWSRLSKQLYAYHFDLMMRSGMADEWMGVARDEPNPVRDFVRLYLSTGVWKLVSRRRDRSGARSKVRRRERLRLPRH